MQSKPNHVPPFLAVFIGNAQETLEGVVRYDVARDRLVYESDDPELLQAVVEEYRVDQAYGREWRPLTDAEFIEHLPRRLTGQLYAVALDEHDEPLDELPNEDRWYHGED